MPKTKVSVGAKLLLTLAQMHNAPQESAGCPQMTPKEYFRWEIKGRFRKRVVLVMGSVKVQIVL